MLNQCTSETTLWLLIEVEAVVMYEYLAQQDDELTLKVGDVIRGIVKMDGGWWKGVLNGRKGVFPDNFVKVSNHSLLSVSSVTVNSMIV